jgi:hypothetical protein
MTTLTKKAKSFKGKVDSTKLYPLADALTMVKACATAKFDESIDVAVQLGIDAKKSDQGGAWRRGDARRHRQDQARGGVRPRRQG